MQRVPSPPFKYPAHRSRCAGADADVEHGSIAESVARITRGEAGPVMASALQHLRTVAERIQRGRKSARRDSQAEADRGPGRDHRLSGTDCQAIRKSEGIAIQHRGL